MSEFAENLEIIWFKLIIGEENESFVVESDIPRVTSQ